MTHAVMLPPTQTLPPVAASWKELFTDTTHGGLFAAPWLRRPLTAPLDEVLLAAPRDLASAVEHLLNVREQCLRAAQCLDPVGARTRYADALAECQIAMSQLHHATEGEAEALATWAQGVHTLILAQRALPDTAESKSLAQRALSILSGIHEPLCAGAHADAKAAETLATEPHELIRRLDNLPTQALDTMDLCRARISMHESIMNQKLDQVHVNHDRALKAVLLWGLANVALMAAFPLNGRFFPTIPWSLPFMLAVLVLWWWTWVPAGLDRPLFFDRVREQRMGSLAEFAAAAHDLPDPAREFTNSVDDLLRQARMDRARLESFYLFALPRRLDTVADTETILREGVDVLSGEWMASVNDRHPMKLDELVATEPSMVPRAIEIYWGHERR